MNEPYVFNNVHNDLNLIKNLINYLLPQFPVINYLTINDIDRSWMRRRKSGESPSSSALFHSCDAPRNVVGMDFALRVVLLLFFWACL